MVTAYKNTAQKYISTKSQDCSLSKGAGQVLVKCRLAKDAYSTVVVSDFSYKFQCQGASSRV